jgi:Uma2 family endonuclease
MPRTLERPPQSTERVSAPTRQPLTRRQCESLVESGELQGRYELVDGEIVSKMGQKPPHAVTVVLLMDWLTRVFGARFVRIQLAMNVAETDSDINEPEPDAVVLNRPITEFSTGHPGPTDVGLVIEVADSSLRFDTRTKAFLYARAGIADYWVLDIVGRQLYVHREPVDGFYRAITVYAELEEAAPLAKPDAAVRVADLLPPLQSEGTTP